MAYCKKKIFLGEGLVSCKNFFPILLSSSIKYVQNKTESMKIWGVGISKSNSKDNEWNYRNFVEYY